MKLLKFRIQNNTDTVDMKNECLGLSAWVIGDSVNTLNTKRGLHIQIRHNKNEETFSAAIKLQNLVASSPAMLNALILALGIIDRNHEGNLYLERDEIRKAICKAMSLDFETITTLNFYREIEKYKKEF